VRHRSVIAISCLHLVHLRTTSMDARDDFGPVQTGFSPLIFLADRQRGCLLDFDVIDTTKGGFLCANY